MTIYRYRYTIYRYTIDIDTQSIDIQSMQDMTIYTCTFHSPLHTHSRVSTLLPALWEFRLSHTAQRNHLKYDEEPAIRSTPTTAQLNCSPIWWEGCTGVSNGATVCIGNRVYWGKTPREGLSTLNVLSSHPATEGQVRSRKRWIACTPPCNVPHIYTGLDQASLQLWNNVGSFVPEVALLETGMKGALQISICSSDGLV